MRNKYSLNAVFFISVFVALFFASCSDSNNWSQFRGPGSNMVPAGNNLPDTWGADTNIKWAYKIDGAGWSSPVIWGDKVFIVSSVPEKVTEEPPVQVGGTPLGGARQGQNAPPPPPAGSDRSVGPGQGIHAGQGRPMGPRPEENDTSFMQDVYRWEVACVDINTGNELWKQVAFKGNPKIKKNPMNTYASETPVTDGERVYAYFGMTGLFCYDMNGKLLWQKDLGSYTTQNGWGTGSSPVLYKGVLYIQVDNDVKSFVIAIDAATGNEKWKVGRDEKTNYNSPIIWKNKIRTELVVGGKTARSYDLATGKVLWELVLGGDQCISSPVADEGHLYIGNGGQRNKGNFFAVKAGAEGIIALKEGETTNSAIEWSTPDAGLGNGSPLLYKGFIYSVGARGGEIVCTNAVDGKQVYKEKIDNVGAVWASPWAYNDKIYFYDEKGVTKVIKAGGTFELLSENKLDDKFWASPAFSDNGMVLRGVEKLYGINKLK